MSIRLAVGMPNCPLKALTLTQPRDHSVSNKHAKPIATGDTKAAGQFSYRIAYRCVHQAAGLVEIALAVSVNFS